LIKAALEGGVDQTGRTIMDRIMTGAHAALLGLAALSLIACGPDGGAPGSSQSADGAAQTRAPERVEVAVPQGEATRYIVLVGGTAIGATELTWNEDGTLSIFHEFRNNGRGPTYNEEIALDPYGYPVSWTVEGATTFGNAVDEAFSIEDGVARWRDSTGAGEAELAGPAMYVPQNASPYQAAIAARALMADADGVIDALPGGQLRLTEIEQFGVAMNGEPVQLTSWALSGATQNPSYILTDGTAFMGVVSSGFAVLAEGLESQDAELRALAAEYGARRYEEIQARTAHRFDGPVRVANVRVFDPKTEALTEPVSVVFEGERITAIEAADASADGETVIDGAGGVLVPGMFEMHAHLGESSAALNIAAGVTSVRDMGNNNEVLSALIERMEAGDVAGPRVFRSGFIEGRSPYNSNNGILVGNEEEALAAVRTYAEAGDFHQIKIYNSTRPEWAPALIEEAHRLGLRVSGHIPAFTDADAMIAAGYDELTHINQLMLGWVLNEGEDTRTLLRLTALKRLPELDLQSEAVQSTIDAMVERGVAIDPTFAIHEALLLSRNGEISPGAADYVDHLPVSSQRSARSAWAAIESEEDDIAYRGAFEQITAALAQLRERGIFMVPGTDMGGGFTYHRELELYQTIGMAPAEILAWASQGMADYLGAGEELGSIDPGKYADFFLIPGDPTEDLKAIKTIAMVVADGVVYFPEEIYPEFGIRPFVAAPAVREG
jgi:imidazolonepropionase-like amidohydrolase